MTSQYYTSNILNPNSFDWIELRVRSQNKQRSKKLKVRKGYNDADLILESILRNL